MTATLLLSLLCLVLAAGGFFFWKKAQQHASERDNTRQQFSSLEERFRPVVDADAEAKRIIAEATAERTHLLDVANAERTRIVQDLADTQSRLKQSIEELTKQHTVQLTDQQILKKQIDELYAEFNALDEEANLQAFGFYKPRFDFVTSTEYQQKIEYTRTAQKNLITAGTAATCSTEWTVNGSVVEGRKNTAQYLKLILRAFNGECDAAIAKVKFNNVLVMETRIKKSYEAINKISKSQHSSISATYLDLRLRELYLVHEIQEKIQAEKEVQRQIREQMREEEQAQRELEKAKLDAEKEERRYTEALRKAQQDVQKATGEAQLKLLAQIEALEQQLTQAQQLKQRAISQAQLTRSGHVYVISNIGSFGEDVYKIGMTRRLDPLDRVKELGDASVPFQFDVHAVIYCDDAPKLENTLHRLFHHRRVNRINERKEFFRASLTEIADAVLANHGAIEFLHEAEAQEYRKTQAMLAEAVSN
jgi:regulator of protease activity HflC (stomatin/prohibitin superfamily)